MKKWLCFAFVVFIINSVSAQLTTVFYSIDNKHSFKDVPFGTTLSIAKSKMGLKQYPGSAVNQYDITIKKYLSLGNYNVDEGYAYFEGEKFFQANFIIRDKDYKKDNYLISYFKNLFGEPSYNEEKGSYTWMGENLNYTFTYNDRIRGYIIGVCSNKVIKDSGADNF